VKIRLDQIATTPSGLVMGVQVRGPGDSWLRFAILDVPYQQIPRHVVEDYWRWLDRDERVEDLDDALPLEFP
jgi:hypothetical protein